MYSRRRVVAGFELDLAEQGDVAWYPGVERVGLFRDAQRVGEIVAREQRGREQAEGLRIVVGSERQRPSGECFCTLIVGERAGRSSSIHIEHRELRPITRA